MNAAIECQCGTVIVYDSLRTTCLTCPQCERRWYQQPEMFGDDGQAAHRMPYMMAGLASNKAVSDEWCHEIIRQIKARHEEAARRWSPLAAVPPPPIPNRVAFVFPEGEPVLVDVESDETVR